MFNCDDEATKAFAFLPHAVPCTHESSGPLASEALVASLFYPLQIVIDQVRARVAVLPCAVAVGSAIYAAFQGELAFPGGSLSKAHTCRYMARPRDCVQGRYCYGCSIVP